jgi:hypothetical protein
MDLRVPAPLCSLIISLGLFTAYVVVAVALISMFGLLWAFLYAMFAVNACAVAVGSWHLASRSPVRGDAR